MAKEKKTKITVIDGPLTRFEEDLENIVNRTEVTLEFHEPVSPQQVQYNLAIYKNKEVYIEEAGSKDLIHGTLSPITKVINCYGILYHRALELPEYHKYKDLRVIRIMRRK